MSHLFLGLDSSTQSLSASVLSSPGGQDADSKLVYETSVEFDGSFPEFGTRNGVLPGEGGEAVSPPQLWVRALEAVFEKLRSEEVDLGSIRCIGVSGQQHGSVYLNATAWETLGKLDPGRELALQLKGIYSRAVAPIWMDATTTVECREITDALGGDSEVCRRTGSRCFERFTGPQIRKFYQSDADGYANTAHIMLVSSFIPSILAAGPVPIDPGDGAGMNLMDIRKRDWDREALEATAPGLHERLPPIAPSDSVAGKLSNYFVKRFGMDPGCLVIPGTGDNPSSLVGLGLVSEGRLGISLGTSDTVFAFMTTPDVDPSGSSHVFGSPTGDYMALSCYKNGSLAREAVRDQFKLSWEEFSRYLEEGVPGNEGRVMLPYFDTEIIPTISKPGVRTFGLEGAGPAASVRAVVEAQMTSMALHAEWIRDEPKAIFATGGASSNKSILRIMADTFNAVVHRQETANAAGLGAAIRALHAWRKARGLSADWKELVAPHLAVSPDWMVRPDPKRAAAMREFREIYRAREREYVSEIRV